MARSDEFREGDGEQRCIFRSVALTKAATRKVLRACAPSLRAAGINPDKFLGCGGQGCVLSANDGDALKISCVAAEAFFHAWLLKLGESPLQRLPSMLPKVRRVVHLPCYPKRDYFAILREDLGDYRAEDGCTYEFYSEAAPPSLKSGKLQLPLDLELVMPHGDVREALTLELLKLEGLPDFAEIAPTERHRLLLKQTIAFLRWCNTRHVEIFDVDEKNWGVRGESRLPVLRDLGFIEHADLPSDLTLPQLAGWTERLARDRSATVRIGAIR